MTAKDKAKELVDRFCKHQSDDYPNSDEDYHSKKCALICVDEIVKVLWHNHEKNSEKMYRYYIEVKKEIEKL
jgi:hypothetical protein